MGDTNGVVVGQSVHRGLLYQGGILREAEEILARFSNQLEIEEREKEAFLELSKKYIKTEKFEVLVENEDLKSKLASSVKKEMKMLAELKALSSEKKVLEQTIQHQIEKKKRRVRTEETKDSC